MTTIAAGASDSVTLAQGSTLKTTGTGTAVLGPGPQANMQIGLLGANAIGPFPRDQVIYISATTQVDYSVAANVSTLPAARLSADGLGLVGTDGKLIRLRNANTFIPFGDSITAKMWSGNTPTGTLVRSGGIITVPYTGHPFMTGQAAIVENTADASFNGTFTVTRVDANTISYPCPGPDGTSAVGGGVVRCSAWVADNGWVTWALMQLGHSLTLLGNAGVGSNTTSQMLARIDADVIAKNPAWCSVMGGINDISTLTAAQIFSNLQAMYQKLRNAGIWVAAFTILPLQSGHGAYTAANLQKIADINHRIRRECKLYPGMVLVDAHAALVDPNSSPLPTPRTNTISTDLVHPTPLGSRLVADTFVKAVSPFIPNNRTLVSSAADNRTVNSANSNIWPYLPNTATGGTASAPVTGNVPTGFQVYVASGAPTVAASGIARTATADGDDYGYNVSVAFTPAAAGDSIQIKQLSSATWNTAVASMAIGKAYVFELAVSVTGVPGSNLSKFYSGVQFTVDGVQYSAFFLSPSNQAFTDRDFQGVMRTTPFILTGSALTFSSIQVNAAANAAGSTVTINVGRVSIREYLASEVVSY